MQFPIKSRFKLTDGFIEKYKHTKPPFGFNGLGEFVYLRCVTIDTPILCSDFIWRNAGELKEGDELISFSENIDEKTKERYLELSKVTHNKIEEANVIGIELENEVYLPKSKFLDDVITIRVNRLRFDNGLTKEQKSHVSETDLDNFHHDYYVRSESGVDKLEKEIDCLIEVLKQDEVL